MRTHNIVAEFACSLNSDGTFKQYRVVNGSIFNEEYNETLDSATLVLSQISKEDRLVNIKPYDYVRVYDTFTYDATTDTYAFDKLFLVDSYNEQENNIKDHIFGYTINLMSETKWLEKIQCPNLTITHTVNSDGTISKKTILQYIRQYMELYVPKIKYSDGDTWSYEPLIKLPYHTGTETVTFNQASFVWHPIQLYYDVLIYSEPLDSSILFDTVNIESFNITSTPTVEFINPKLEKDTANRRFKFTAIVSGIPGTIAFYSTSSTITTGINGNYIYPVGEPMKVVVTSDVIDSEINMATITNETVSFNPFRLRLNFSNGTITTNTTNRTLTYTAEAIEELPGTITFSFSYETQGQINGTLTINYNYDSRNDSFTNRFDVPCADLAFTTPTLRQLLTTLMQQVGCIPVVHNRTLGFLDFQAPGQAFGGDKGYDINNTVNFIRRGLSSDSFANSLVNMSSNVLDSENEVICETLGFRDRSNVLLKQQENLCLETNFPIYKVNKALLHVPGRFGGTISSGYGCVEGLLNQNWLFSEYSYPMCFYSWVVLDTQNNFLSWELCVAPDMSSSDGSIQVKDITLSFLGKNDNDSYYLLEKRKLEDFYINYGNTSSKTLTFGANTATEATLNVRVIDKVFNNINAPVGTVSFRIEGTFFIDDDNFKDFIFMKFASSDNSHLTAYGPFQNDAGSFDLNSAAIVAYAFSNYTGGRVLDITKLIVENSVRGLLDRDFEKMGNEMASSDTWTVDNLSKYVYGTVGYSIGSNKIEGFSEVFNVGSQTPVGWIQKDYTYIENIIIALQNDFSCESDFINQFFGDLSIIISKSNDGPVSWGDPLLYALEHGTYIDPSFTYWTPPFYLNGILLPGGFTSYASFTTLFVDLYYQPLNSFNISYIKSIEDIDIPIEQYDSNASGLTDFDRLSIHEQEQVDRIGNDTLTISQRTDDYDDIQDFSQGPLIFMDDTNRDGSVTDDDNGIKYVIFKRSYTVNNNCFNASYVGSKDAVLKNYFTSIRTKYRAYQYVDYSQSVLRKEKDVFYVRIARNYYNGDDRVWIGNYYYNDRLNLRPFIYDIYNNNKGRNPVSYEVECDLGSISNGLNGSSLEQQIIKNSVSSITTKNMFAIIYECPDNVGAGVYIKDLINMNNKLGGIPQSWQVWGDNYATKHTVTFVDKINFYDFIITENISTSEATQILTDELKKIQLSPIVDPTYLDLENGDNVCFSIVDDNGVEGGSYTDVQRTFYKDAAERINHTTQFVYYAPDGDVLFGEDFVAGVPVINRFSSSFNALVPAGSFVLRDDYYRFPASGVEGNDIYSYVQAIGIGIIINWHDKEIIRLCHKEGNYAKDIAVFKRPEGEPTSTTFYFMINDTKTDYVMSEKNGILYRRYKVSTSDEAITSLDRTVEKIYNEED